MPRSACFEKRRSAICWPVSASRLPVGSSAINTAGGGCKRAGDCNTLLFATRELAGIMVEAFAETDSNEFPFGDLEGVRHVGQFQRNGYVFQRRHIGDEVERLENDADILAAEIRESILAELMQFRARYDDLAAIQPFETGKHHQKGRFSRTGRADDPHRLAFANGKIDALENVNGGGGVAEREVGLLKLYDAFRHNSRSYI